LRWFFRSSFLPAFPIPYGVRTAGTIAHSCAHHVDLEFSSLRAYSPVRRPDIRCRSSMGPPVARRPAAQIHGGS
jgi:hypothetical protein